MRGSRFPEWLRKTLPAGGSETTTDLLKELGLNTVCAEAKCPNRTECFSKKRATFMILGDKCTRNCAFCAVNSSCPDVPNMNEPETIALAVRKLGLKYVVITMVSRDDLGDGGADHFARTVKSVRSLNPGIKIEILPSDMQGNEASIRLLCESGIEVFNHNIETVSRLYSEIRPQAGYERSLKVLTFVKEKFPSIFTKTGIMVGLGEEKDEVFQLMRDVRDHGVDLMTIGQYLQADKDHYPVKRFVTPEEYKEYEEFGASLGFSAVYAGPFVRSSYTAEELFNNI